MRIALLALGFASAVVTAASAQSYGPAEPQSGNSNEVVTVTAPEPQERRRSELGAPIVNVALSREVRFDDLDLSTARGTHALRERVRHTASALCREIDARYLVTNDDDRHCVRQAVDEAMDQAEPAIAGSGS